MKIYTDPLPEIQSFYKNKNLLKVIDGERTLDVIVDEMDNFIQSKITLIVLSLTIHTKLNKGGIFLNLKYLMKQILLC